MRTAILYPTVLPLIEKMGVLFGAIDVVGPPMPGQLGLGNVVSRLDEWRDLGLDVAIKQTAFADIDFGKYDLVIDSAETCLFSPEWAQYCHRVECPTIIRASWLRDPAYLPDGYKRKKELGVPVLIEHPPHADVWRAAGWPDVTVLSEPAGNWWFEREWTGSKERVLFVLAGKDIWRPENRTYLGLDVWDRLVERFPGKTLHHDGAVNYKTMRQMSELFSESRVFVNLDTPYGNGERALTMAFTEALCAGLPVVARDLPGLSYREFINGNGICTNDFDSMCHVIEHCLSDLDYARARSNRSRQIGKESFSVDALRPAYDAAIARAQAAFQKNGG